MPEDRNPYEMWGGDAFASWLLNGPSPQNIRVVQQWIYDYCGDPKPGIPMPGYPPGVYTQNVPETDTWATWFLDTDARKMWLIEVENPEFL